jgi:tRNA (guanine37-N1)-methyltransferase
LKKKDLKATLSQILSAEDLTRVCKSFDIVGDIAITRFKPESKKHHLTIANAIMDVHKNVRTVLAQTSSVRGNFRLRKLDYITGEKRTVTIHKEFGCLFRVDVRKSYFSPRLIHERMRIARQVGNREKLVNMFAGVGCFSIVIAKNSNAEKVYSIDINPAAFMYMQENIRRNRVYQKVVPLLGDAKEVIKTKLCHVVDRVVMPLPGKAFEYLPYSLLALKQRGGWIHYYDFECARKSENPIEKVTVRTSEKLRSLGATFKIPFGRKVRSTGPNWHQIALDINVTSQSKQYKS